MATGPSLSFQTHSASITAARDLGLFETCNYFFIDVDSNNIIGKIPMQGFSLGQKKYAPHAFTLSHLLWNTCIF